MDIPPCSEVVDGKVFPNFDPATRLSVQVVAHELEQKDSNDLCAVGEVHITRFLDFSTKRLNLW